MRSYANLNLWSHLCEPGSQLESTCLRIIPEVVDERALPSLPIELTQATFTNLKTRTATKLCGFGYLYKATISLLSHPMPHSQEENQRTIGFPHQKKRRALNPILTVEMVVAFPATHPRLLTHLSLLPHSSILDPSIRSSKPQQFGIFV